MTRKLLELSASLLCVAVTIAIGFACFQMHRITEATIEAQSDTLAQFALLQQIGSLQRDTGPARPLFDAGAKDRGTATQIMEELRQIDSATKQWAIETNQKLGATVAPKDLAPYLKRDSPLEGSCLSGRPLDSLGNPKIVTSVGNAPSFSLATFDRLSSVAPLQFWRPFSVAE